MIHTVLQIPPLGGARCNAPQLTTISQGEDAGHPAGASPLLTSPGIHSAIPSGRATGAATGAFVPVAAIEDVLAERAPAAWTAVLDERRRQIAKFGHTPQSDAALPLKQLPREAARFVNMAIEDCQFQRADWRTAARKHLIRAGAMILAAMDRIEAEPEEEFPL